MKVFRMQAVGVVIPRRAFHCSHPLRAKKAHFTLPEAPSKKRFMPTRQAVIQVPDPKKTTIGSIVSRFGNLRPNEMVWKKRYHPSRHAIIILATPGFANYLEQESDFVPLLLQSMNWPSASGENVLQVDVVCGCVDGLPPAANFIPQARGKSVEEGFSILYGETSDVMPQYALEKQTKTKATSTKPGSITFQGADISGMKVTLPLANTIFKNGRLSTLLASKWEATESGYKQIESQTSIDSVSLNALGMKHEAAPEFYIPAIPLTYARELRDGFGNIIRTLQFVGPDGFTFHPASSELEIKVPQFLKDALGKMASLKIWALIIPRHIAQKVIGEKSSTLRVPDREFEESTPIEDYREIGHWISRGARLARVQSGGGGWGPKAGMLSLDPEYVYSSSPEISLAMDDSFMDKNKLPGLEDIAKTGSYIQFFTARETRTKGKFEPTNNSVETMRRATVIGTIPSSIDSMGEQTEEEKIKFLKDQKDLDITAIEADAFHKKAIELLQVPFVGPGRPEEQVEAKVFSTNLKKEQPDDGFTKEGYYMKSLKIPREMYFRKGEFGCVSESGMFVTQSGAGKNQGDGMVETKIDIPYSFVSKMYGESTFRIRRQLS